MDPAAWSYDSVDGVVRNSRGYPVLNVASHTEIGHRAGRLAAQAPNMLEALRKIASGKGDASMIARDCLMNAVTYSPVR